MKKLSEDTLLLLKLVFDRENDIFFWQNKAAYMLDVSDEKLFQELKQLATEYLVRFDWAFAGMKYVDGLCLTMDGLEYLYENDMISEFDYHLRLNRMQSGQHEV